MPPQLERPSLDYEDSYTAAVREFQAEGMLSDVNLRDIPAHIQVQLSKERVTVPGRVPETVYWLMNGGDYLGTVSLRHHLNSSLRQIGGHIGYRIRPSQRRKGYGTLILRLVLPEARRLGLDRVLVTCDAINIGSQKIIAANGGVLQDEIMVTYHPNRVQRWWIGLA